MLLRSHFLVQYLQLLELFEYVIFTWELLLFLLFVLLITPFIVKVFLEIFACLFLAFFVSLRIFLIQKCSLVFVYYVFLVLLPDIFEVVGEKLDQLLVVQDYNVFVVLSHCFFGEIQGTRYQYALVQDGILMMHTHFAIVVKSHTNTQECQLRNL